MNVQLLVTCLVTAALAVAPLLPPLAQTIVSTLAGLVGTLVVRPSQVNNALGAAVAKIPGKPAPPALFIMLALAMGLSSCATVKPVVIPIAKHCGQAVSADVLPAIESALVAQDYVVELTALVTKFGVCVVNDAVKLIQGEAIGDLSFASSDVNSQILVQHATAWLNAHPE